jgi:hypothetical protein
MGNAYYNTVDLCDGKWRTSLHHGTTQYVYSQFIIPYIALSLVASSFTARTRVQAQENTNNNDEEGNDENDLSSDIIESFSGLGPYLIAASLLIFIMHYSFQPIYMTRNLMKVDYLQHGAPAPVMGQALSFGLRRKTTTTTT